MADSFIKPPFLSWGVRPVASRGLGEPDDAPQALYIRGPSVSVNNLAANFDLFNTLGFFDFVLPADWDNSPAGGSLDIEIIGGVLADDGVAPPGGTFDVFCQWWLDTVNGGSWIGGALSASGNGFAVGAVGREWFGQGLATSFGYGLGQTDTGFYSTDNVSVVSTTYKDATPLGYPGDSYADPAGPGGDSGPPGWFPPVGTASFNDGTPQALLSAGQTVTIALYLFTDNTNVGDPDHTIFGAVQEINLIYNGTTYNIPITSVQVGWNNGDNYMSFDNGVDDIEVFPNPRRTVEPAAPPILHPQQQAWIDWYIVYGSIPTGDRITEAGEPRITEDGAQRIYTEL